MSKLIRVKRGLESRRITYTPALGEMVWTTDNHEMWVGDGVTVGGVKLTASIEDLFVKTSEKAMAGGVASLDANGKIPVDQIPAVAISEVWVVNNEAEQLALPAETGDVVVRVDLNQSFIHNSGTSNSMNDWTLLSTPTDSILSVNGQTGAVVLNLGDIDGVDLSGGVLPGDLIQWNGNAWVPIDSSGIGRTEFKALNDTPNSYVGQDNNLVVVDEANDRVVFTDVIDGGSYGSSRPAATLSKPSRQATRQSTRQSTRVKRPKIKRL